MESQYEQEKARYLQYLDQSSNDGGALGHAFENTPLFSLAVQYTPRHRSKSNDSKSDSGEIVNRIPSSNAADDSSDYNYDRAIEDLSHLGVQPSHASTPNDKLSQFGLLGYHVGTHSAINYHEPVLFNTRAPNSTFLCGSQGSGKSYTLGCILENCLLAESHISEIANPLGGVAFHYDNDSPCAAEVAGLCSRGVEVNVLVPSSNYAKLKALYDSVATGGGSNAKINVSRLLLKDEHLDIACMHKLMAFDSTGDNGVPLYVAVINDILLNMAVASGEKTAVNGISMAAEFSMAALERKLDDFNFAPAQRNMLNMRMQLLRTFLESKAKPKHRADHDLFAVKPGSLTIVDLSDPFIDESMVCTLFDICLGLFKERKPKDGLIVTLDEAHKYLKDSPGAIKFTDHLMSTIRMQRHHATRVVIATQEPTISGGLLDLCSTSIVHRFSSPAWFEAIKEHLGAASSLVASTAEQKALFEGIVNLGTGESFVFSPSSFLCFKDGKEGVLGADMVKMKTRSRTGKDLGRSKMAGET